MDIVNYQECKLHENGLEIVNPRNSNCRITFTNKLSTRGKIDGFSARSANRLRRLLLDIDFHSSWAVCLTLPNVNSPANFDFAALWHGFCVRWSQIHPNAYVWRVELQQRKVPHWHLVFCGDYQSVLQFKYFWHDFVSKRIVCSLPFFLHSVKVQQIYSGSSALMYLTAHLSKHKKSQLGWKGRQWGVINRKSLHLLPPCSSFFVPALVWRDVSRQFRRLSEHLDKQGIYSGAFGKSRFRSMIFGRDEERFMRIYRYYFDRWRDCDKMSHYETRCHTV